MGLILTDSAPGCAGVLKIIERTTFYGDPDLMNEPYPVTKLRAIGIDVGFFSTKFTTGRTTEGVSRSAIPTDQFPSIAPFQHTDVQGPADTARREGVRIVVDGVAHYVGKDTLLESGGFGTTAVAPDYSMTTAYKALFRGALHEIARANDVRGDLVIEMLVGGLPMASFDDYRTRLEAFMLESHVMPHPADRHRELKVTISRTKVLGQPQGSLVNHQLSRGVKFAPGQMTLVLDLGGGTFDWFVAKEVQGSRSRSGSAPIGALACASAVCAQMKDTYQHSPIIMSRVDEALRIGAETVTISGVPYKMAGYAPTVKAVLLNALEQMRKSAGNLAEMDAILFTGGGARLLHAIAQEHLAEHKRVFAIDEDAVVSNVRGFHFWAEHLRASQGA